MKVKFWEVGCSECGERQVIEGTHLTFECKNCGETENYKIERQGIAYE